MKRIKLRVVHVYLGEKTINILEQGGTEWNVVDLIVIALFTLYTNLLTDNSIKLGRIKAYKGVTPLAVAISPFIHSPWYHYEWCVKGRPHHRGNFP